ncbi:MFS transporter [Ectobacillus ponti]|uniref:MFS transporter n=1 Tax=Ectobacillus ponti TaxID=2961894 RepID=A0AA41X6J7_9BACI|nr:MFS transporter [Ectobacillus ponti]MCP8967549.1 MFS transporter [Ectobacillus ponti]
MEIFQNRTFTKLFLAMFTSQLGSTIGNMAFAFYLLEHFSSKPYYATLAEMMYAAPALLVFFLVGVLADRMDRKRIAESSDWIRAGLTVLLLAAVLSHSLFFIFLILFLRSAVTKFFGPAETGILQGILDQEQYMQASGLNQSVMGVFMLFGVGLGALSYHYLGITWSVVIDGISFVISALLIRSCHISEAVRRPNGKTHFRDISFQTIFTDFKQGILYIKSYKLLLSILFAFFVFGLVNGGFAVLPLFTMKYKLAPGHYEQFASLFSIFLGVGFVAGSAISSKVIEKLQPHRVLILGIFLTGILTFVVATMTNVWLYLVCIGITGLLLAPVNVALGGWMNELVDPKMIGRVNAWVDPFMTLAHTFALGLIAVAFPGFVSIDVLYYVLGGLLLFVSCYYLLVLPKLVQQPAAQAKGQLDAQS